MENRGQTLTTDPVRLAKLGAQINDPLLQTILVDYLAAHQVLTPHDVGEHWNNFLGDFNRLIRTAEIWPQFRRMAISYGLDDSLKYSESRNRPDLKPTLHSHRGPFVQAWQFNDKALREDMRRLIRITSLSAERIQALGEAKIGDPAAQRFSDSPVQVDYHDLSQIYFASSLERALSGQRAARVLEIGGG